MARNQKTIPIKSTTDRNVFFTLTIDKRKRSKNEEEYLGQKSPIAVLVCNSGKIFGREREGYNYYLYLMVSNYWDDNANETEYLMPY